MRDPSFDACAAALAETAKSMALARVPVEIERGAMTPGEAIFGGLQHNPERLLIAALLKLCPGSNLAQAVAHFRAVERFEDDKTCPEALGGAEDASIWFAEEVVNRRFEREARDARVVA